jgi:hypothetical protein
LSVLIHLRLERRDLLAFGSQLCRLFGVIALEKVVALQVRNGDHAAIVKGDFRTVWCKASALDFWLFGAVRVVCVFRSNVFRVVVGKQGVFFLCFRHNWRGCFILIICDGIRFRVV